jgi:hypothetical protein
MQLTLNEHALQKNELKQHCVLNTMQPLNPNCAARMHDCPLLAA